MDRPNLSTTLGRKGVNEHVLVNSILATVALRSLGKSVLILDHVGELAVEWAERPASRGYGE